ncbi:ATP-binding protein [Comamonas sp. JNW]|uniref:sensor histidine kinase n=1 Tax=Comamonas sp. JNW TaxID=2170731 RepID=UPI000DE7274B|nr:ATP-binding protein [Comamonas sp. JNW]PWB21418.1 two-component sensor histidine kinase [Comamonas sp. JNW]
MTTPFLPPQLWRRPGLHVMAMLLALVLLFLIDTATRYEVAVSVFYTVVIVAMAHVLALRGLMVLTGSCIALTWLSFFITRYGDLRAGQINMLISTVAILITGYLACRAELARAAAHEAQARLLRISRIHSLEGLATSIAHELNQPLAAIVTSGHACQRWMEQDPPNLDKARQALLRILGDADRASAIIGRVRKLSKGEPASPRPFVFNAAVREVLALSQAEIQRLDIAMRADLAAGLPLALADPVQVQQVIANLVLNAMEATALVDIARRTILVESLQLQDKLVFRVSDGGPGLPAGAQEQVFEPFWTTKHEGIGVGLSISRSIVESNGGHIWAEPHVQGGAVFAFSVPVAPQEGPA